ncbi:MAG: glycosyltransferase family 2 protein [Acutalibacteraceae bacterium]
MRVLAVFTCYNRKEKTKTCIETLVNGNPSCEFSFIAVDDNSTDGTSDMLKKMKEQFVIYSLSGSGSLFYSGGMRLGMQYALRNLGQRFDYLMMINDDAEFFDGCIGKMIEQSVRLDGAVIVGAMCNYAGALSYGALKYDKGTKYHAIQLKDCKMQADTFNANCVLIPYHAFEKTGAVDEHYIHSLGDFDYGLELKRNGFRIFSSEEYVGVCQNNPTDNTWSDAKLGRIQRFMLKESPKGAPFKPRFYFLKKNFGIFTAIKGSLTPYIRIIIGK